MNWKILCALLIGFILGGCCHHHGNVRHPPPAIYSETNDYHLRTMLLHLENVGGTAVSAASGFPIDKERIVTAGHFCMAAVEGSAMGLLKEGIIVNHLNDNDEVAPLAGRAEIMSIDEKMDLCVIRLPKHGLVPFKLADYSKVRVKDPVVVVGAPLGIFPVETRGHTVELQSSEFPVVALNGRLIVTAPATFGNSGGPILNERGEVIGVVMAKTPYEHLIFGVTVDTLKQHLKEEYGE